MVSPARLALSLGLGLAVGVSGCATILGFEDTTLRSETDEAGTIEGGTLEGGGTGAGGGALSTKPASIVVRRGATVDVEIDLARSSGVTGAVTARLSDLPMGVTATTATLAPASSTGTLKVSAIATAALGPATVTLVADGAPLAPSKVPLLVSDAPGSLDMTFDSDGLVNDASRGMGTTFLALAVQADQRIVAGGGVAAAAGAPLGGWIVRRYASNGVPDTAFNTLASAAGVMPADGQLDAIAIDAKGNIVCVGVSQPAPTQQLTIVRLLPTGALDPSFGNGIVRIAPEVPVSATVGLGVVVQADGGVIVVGARHEAVGNKDSGIVVRFTDKGVRDPTFNAGQTVVVPGVRFVGAALEGGAIVASGSTVAGAPSYVVVRRTAQGAVDPTYGMAGVATFGTTYRANASTRLADGTIALAGDVQQGAAGYTAGAVSAKGAALFARTYASSAGAGLFGIAAQADGRVVAAGHTAAANGEARVERILADGNKDTSFGMAGTAIVEPAGTPNGFDVTLFAAAVQADGRILAAGNRTNAGAVVYRLWP
ncbi:MAG: toxin [Labilithrix sp.]|nr:toxin [Labilithrix sp.]